MNEIPKLAEATIVYSPSVKPSEMPMIECSKDVAALVLPSWEQLYEVESVKALLMNKANKVLGIKVIATGGQDSCLVDQRVILRSALLSVACAIILIHNHPSGSKKPSEADIKMTKMVQDACKQVGVQLLDHVIVTDKDGENFFSFADECMI